MRFYEVRFLCDLGEDSNKIEQQAKASVQNGSTPMKVFGVTIHNRPSAVNGAFADASVMVAVESMDDTEEDFDELAGRMAWMYGYHMTYSRKLGEKSLSLKGDLDAVDDFVEDALNSGKASPVGETDDEEFTVTEIEDKADTNE